VAAIWIEAAVRRQVLITNEANAIGTAYLRIDLLPATQHAVNHGIVNAREPRALTMTRTRRTPATAWSAEPSDR